MGGMTGRVLAKQSIDEDYLVGGTIHKKLPEELSRLAKQGLLKYYSVDLKNFNETKTAIENFQPDILVHLAGRVFGGVDKQALDPIIFTENILIFQNVLNAVKKLRNTPRFILSSGCLVYEKSTSPNFITEISTQDLPRIDPKKEPYRASKLSQELLLSDEKNIDYVIARPTQFTGPGKIQGVIEWYIAEEILKIKAGEENQIKVRNKLGEVDLIDVRDVAKAFLTLIKRGTSRRIYHISSGSPINVENLAKIFLKVTGLDPNKYPVTSTNSEQLIYFRFSPAKLNKLNWKPQFNLTETLANYWEYYNLASTNKS